MNLLISIHPEYVEKIVSGEKKIEFRKNIFKKDIKNILVYSTSPVKKIVGYFEFKGYEKDTPLKLWENYSDIGGIVEEKYFKYFYNKENAYGILIEKFIKFKESKPPELLIRHFTAPQSFMYVDNDTFEKIKKDS